MTEAIIANLALVLRVFLIGGLLLILPHIIRKGLLFGVYVGEGVAKGEAARQLLRRWRHGCILVMMLPIVVGLAISAAGWPLAGNLIGTAVLLCAALVLYLHIYSRARELVPPEAARQAQKAVASLSMRRTRAAGIAKTALAVCLITSLSIIVYAVAAYRVMPDQVPVLTGTGALSEKSIVDYIFLPAFTLVASTLFALLALLIAGAKRSLREGEGSRSVEAQDAFQVFMTNLLSFLALLFCAALSLLSVQIIRVGLSEASSIVAGVLWAAGCLVFFSLLGLIWIIRSYGQGGALREYGSVKTPLTGSLTDNDSWVWGLFYFDRGDSSIMVEKRFGLGYTLNYGNRYAVLFTVTYLALYLGLAALAASRFL